MALFEGRVLDDARSIMARYPEGRERSAIMPLLYLAQSIDGMVTRDALREIGALLRLTTAEVEAVATFYTMYRLRPTGAHVVSVCTNLSCTLLGARDVYDAGHRAAGIRHGNDISDDGVITLHEEECLGVCEFAPAVQIDYANHDKVTPERMTELIGSLQRGEVPSPARGPAWRDFRHASLALAGLDTEREANADVHPETAGPGEPASEGSRT
jgi:NADH-quinone oxidoreductase subunit E